jgi:hypothetical protein
MNLRFTNRHFQFRTRVTGYTVLHVFTRPDSFAVVLCARIVPIICSEKSFSRLGYSAAHDKHVHAYSEHVTGALRAHSSMAGEDSLHMNIFELYLVMF